MTTDRYGRLGWCAFGAAALSMMLIACPVCMRRGPVTYEECRNACAELGVAAFIPGRYTTSFACTCVSPPPPVLESAP